MDKTSFRRKAYDEMLAWKSRLADRYALLIEGARRVGKTFLIRDFVAKEYQSSIFIDFSHSDKQTKAVKKEFANADGVEDLLTRLEFLFKTRLVPGESCVVFDEVQRFPVAREMIKSFMEYGKYHFIESGSLVGIKENVKDIQIPSEEHGMKMFPLDFEEFLDAIGETMMKDLLRERFNERRPLGETLHGKAMSLFRLYMAVGGMPQSVEAYLSAPDHALEAAENAKREILALYDRDIGKYAKGYASKVRSLFRTMPAELSKREKKFHLSDIDVNARMRRYENAFLWLEDAMIANVAYNATNPNVGLAMYRDNSSFKCYSLDTGLLLTQAMSGEPEPDGRLLRAVLHDNMGVNEGMFFENVVAQTLAARGRALFFYSRTDSNDNSNTMEIDFLVKNGIKVSPIEVKSANYRSHKSLDRLMAKFSGSLGLKYVICTADYHEADGIVYLPAYMAHLI
ncbi:MAG: ATP-binding protein [Kiritimatiellae bacterium]|nr:ATP-binding protein [Kiritimatiellia bacterium]